MNAPTALAEHETIVTDAGTLASSTLDPVLTETETETSVWEQACAVEDLEPSWGEAALLRARQIALFLFSGEEIYAVAHRDPHTDAPVMARGIVGSRGERPTVASPLHKEVYDLGTGECFTNPALVLQTFRTRVVGGMIEVELPL
ncbi:nitrite reductase small subunit NirD [Leifsonia sp. YIM 134122]|uniref:Nitrite reductase small subunit NirD n=1 Tax=Leifsonia stereocauli TaxID=3134136 RepID=A0ABU9W0S4_9MICO